MGRGVIDRRRFSVKGREDVCAEGQGVKGRNNLVTS